VEELEDKKKGWMDDHVGLLGLDVCLLLPLSPVPLFSPLPFYT